MKWFDIPPSLGSALPAGLWVRAARRDPAAGHDVLQGPSPPVLATHSSNPTGSNTQATARNSATAGVSRFHGSCHQPRGHDPTVQPGGSTRSGNRQRRRTAPRWRTAPTVGTQERRDGTSTGSAADRDRSPPSRPRRPPGRSRRRYREADDTGDHGSPGTPVAAIEHARGAASDGRGPTVGRRNRRRSSARSPWLRTSVT